MTPMKAVKSVYVLFVTATNSSLLRRGGTARIPLSPSVPRSIRKLSGRGSRQALERGRGVEARRVLRYISELSRLAVARSGFEPLISALRGLHPRPLDERAGE